MAERTGIEWTNHAFSPWFGCTKMSPACDLCYAEHFTVKRFHKAGWGNAPRVRSADSTWKRPLDWQRKAVNAGVRRRVFCSHLSDVFDNQAPAAWRTDIWALIAKCPDLDWLLVTKRPQNIAKMLPEAWPWPNVWLGTTAENQQEWNRRVPLLRGVPAVMKFVSVEPMLEPIEADLTGVDWLVCGGETDPERKHRERYMDPDWARALQEAGREVVSTDLADYGWEECRSGIDYLSARPPPSIEGIVTNPPFRLAVKFARKAIGEVPYVALLLRTNFLESKGRLPFFGRTPPTRIWVSSSRLPFMHRYKWEGQKSSSNICYAWFIWQAGAAREPNGWFDWKEICQPLPLFAAAA